MNRSIEDIYGVPFPDNAYPEGFLDRFERETKVLASTDESCVCIVKERSSGIQYTARYIFPVIDEENSANPSADLFQDNRDRNRALREYSVLDALNKGGSLPGIPSDPGWYPGTSLSIGVHRFAEGVTLEEFAGRDRLNRKEGPAGIYRRILSVAEHLHGHSPSAVHLDIKPENIIIGPGETVTFIDFESALLPDPDGTAWGGSRGTRPYAAPEQLIEPYSVDQRTDIYALGVLLRFVYTGSAEARTDRPLQEKLGRIVEKCTRPDPKDRFQSVKELSAAFEKAIEEKKAGLPVFIAVLAAAALVCAGLFFLRPSTKADTVQMEVCYVYKDFGAADNHFPEKMQMQSPEGIICNRMDENYPSGEKAGDTCICCEVGMEPLKWCGYCFLNGIYDPERKAMILNEGLADGQGIRLSGAKELRFLARGAKGGEQAEFFCCGFGYDGETGAVLVPFPDTSEKRSTGVLTLTSQWQEYSISLVDADLENIACGFGYVVSGGGKGSDISFFLDEIRFLF